MEAFPLNWVTPTRFEIHVSGDIINFNLFTSKETHIKVGGDMKNSNFPDRIFTLATRRPLT